MSSYDKKCRCNIEENDHQVVICDGCNLGIHTYCMRPVMNNVPTGDWYCDRCKSVHDAARQPYSSLLAELEKDPTAAMAFLGHGFDATKFYETHKEGLTLFGPETAPHVRRKRLGSSKSTATAKIGVRKPLHFNLNGIEIYCYLSDNLTATFFSISFTITFHIPQDLFFSW